MSAQTTCVEITDDGHLRQTETPGRTGTLAPR